LSEALLQLGDTLSQAVCEIALAGDGGSLTAILGPMVSIYPGARAR